MLQPTLALEIGTRLGPYEILAPLGAGGMGEVYRARDPRLGRDVALKVLAKSLIGEPEQLRRFRQEARAAGSLNHPNILATYDIGAHEDSPYVVSELLEGETLRARLEQPLGSRKAVDLATQVARGLAAAHEKGIVHRDLKPENLFITRDGLIKILDFGLAKVCAEEPLADQTADTASVGPVTHPGTILGTLGYMSPEQVRGQPVDHRSDIFSFGTVLFEMLSGLRPFAGDTPADTVSAILTREPADISSSCADIPVGLSRIVIRCLDKKPEERFQSARDLAFALEELSSARQVMPPRPAAAADPRPSIAVLPFANLSADPEQEFFCDGTAEEIINALVHVEGLRVIARTSSFAFKGKHEDIREIGARLDVKTILEGSVRKAGSRLRITAQLISVADGSHLWSERYDRKLEDVFAIQDEISLAIVESLKVKLLDGERASVVHRHTESLDAHNTYLMGLFEWNKMSPEGLARSLELYDEAIRIDPGLAPAYSHLADAITSLTWWADQPATEVPSKALPLARKALELDGNHSHAHCVMGHCLAFFERDWVTGERHLRRAVELSPNDAFTQIYLALLVGVAGSAEEASSHARAAQRLDPLSPAVNSWAGWVLVGSGYVDEAIRGLEQQVAMAPHLWMPRYIHSHALAVAGRLEEAREAAKNAVELSGGASCTLCHLGCLDYLLEDRESADEHFARLRERAEAGYVAPMLLAWMHLVRGEAERAAREVERALEGRDPWVGVHRVYAPPILPADPRIERLIADAMP